MKYLIDTCIISDFFKKIPSVITHFENVKPTQIHISALTVMEIEYGLKLQSEREKKIRPVWHSLLATIEVVPYSTKCAVATAQLRARLKLLGLPIGPFDILIAGTAAAYGFKLVTSNLKEFQRLTELSMENW